MRKIINYINTDGLLHIIVSFVLVCLFSTFMPVLLADWLTITIGFGKEVYDYKTGRGHAESRDLVCDAIGVVIGTIIVLLIKFID